MSRLRNVFIALGALAALALATGSATAAPFADAYVTTTLNLRAGPSTSYPAVVKMRAGDRVTIYGCLSGWTWCDIGWHGYRGWAAGRYLEILYRNYRRPIISYGPYIGLPFITFSIGTYWDQYYRHRPFFRQMPHYQNPGPQFPPQNGPPPQFKPHCKPGQKWMNGVCM